jgi:hypothetical protein
LRRRSGRLLEAEQLGFTSLHLFETDGLIARGQHEP